MYTIIKIACFTKLYEAADLQQRTNLRACWVRIHDDLYLSVYEAINPLRTSSNKQGWSLCEAALWLA